MSIKCKLRKNELTRTIPVLLSVFFAGAIIENCIMTMKLGALMRMLKLSF